MQNMPPPAYSSSSDRDERVKLWSGTKERAYYDSMSDMFAILMATQHLEKAYIRSSIPEDAYTEQCQKLIAQFKTTEEGLKQSKFDFADTKKFIRQYRIECPLAVTRLLEHGVPATVMHAATDSSRDTTVLVAEATQFFITALDTLKLDQRAVDEIHPIMKDLVETVNKTAMLTRGAFDPSTLQNWLITLNSMRASEELDEDQLRQLTFDLEDSYNNFMSALRK